MMDEFERKRGMIKVLQDALKKHAGDEVVGGFSQRKEMTHSPVPKGDVADKPHMKESFKAGEQKPEMGAMPTEGAPMAKGGQVPYETDLSLPFAKNAQPASNSSKMAEGGLAEPHPDLEEPVENNHVHNQMCAGGCAYADGGMALASDEPERELTTLEAPGGNDALGELPEKPMDEQGSEVEQQIEHNKENEEEDQNNNSSAFDAFFPRKRKK